MVPELVIGARATNAGYEAAAVQDCGVIGDGAAILDDNVAEVDNNPNIVGYRATVNDFRVIPAGMVRRSLSL